MALTPGKVDQASVAWIMNVQFVATFNRVTTYLKVCRQIVCVLAKHLMFNDARVYSLAALNKVAFPDLDTGQVIVATFV